MQGQASASSPVKHFLSHPTNAANTTVSGSQRAAFPSTSRISEPQEQPHAVQQQQQQGASNSGQRTTTPPTSSTQPASPLSVKRAVRQQRPSVAAWTARRLLQHVVDRGNSLQQRLCMVRSRLQQAVRTALQLCQLVLIICISLLLLLPRQILRLILYAVSIATSVLHAVLPSSVRSPLNLASPLTPRDAHRNLRSHHFPPVLIRRQFLTVGHELMATELLSIEPFTLLPSSSPRSASGAVADFTFSPPPPPPPPPAPSSPPVHFVLITGNPGSAHFYTAFLSHLHSLSGHSLSVSCLSFAGHQSAHQLHHFTPRRPYSLLDQTRLWQAFIAQLLEKEPHARIVLAGHSIGAWIALQCAASIPRGQLLHSFLLFPTLWDMSSTPAGRRLRLVFAYGQRVLPLAARLMNALLPSFIRRHLILRALSTQHWSSPSSPVTTNSLLETEDAVRTVSDLLHPACVRQILHMAHSELTTVTAAFPSASMTRELSEGRASLVCAADDAWNPAWQQEEMRRRYGAERVIVMDSGIQHAFVIGGSCAVAETVWKEMDRHRAQWDAAEAETEAAMQHHAALHDKSRRARVVV